MKASGAAVLVGGEVGRVAASEYLGVPAGGRSGGLDSYLLLPSGRINPPIERTFGLRLLLSRPLIQGASF